MSVEKKTVDRIFFILAGVLGMLVFVFAVQAFKNLNNNCSNMTIDNCLTILQCLGAALTTFAITYGFCNYSHDCYATRNSEDDNGMFFLKIATPIAAVIAIVSAIAGSEISKYKICQGTEATSTDGDKADGDRLKFYVWFTFALSLFMLFVSLGTIIYSEQVFDLMFRTDL